LLLEGQTPTLSEPCEFDAAIYANDPMRRIMDYQQAGSPAFMFDPMEPG
jgi:hypothetical protein